MQHADSTGMHWLHTMTRTPRTIIGTRRRLIIAVSVSVSVLLGISFVLANGDETSEQLARATDRQWPHETFSFSAASSTYRIPVTGTLEASRRAAIAAEHSGQVTSVSVSVGDTVAAGQRLAEIAHATRDAEVAAARARLEQARRELTRTRVEARNRVAAASTSLESAHETSSSTLEQARAARESAYTRALSDGQQLVEDAVAALVTLAQLQTAEPGHAGAYDRHRLAAAKAKAVALLVGDRDAGEYVARYIADSHGAVRGTLEQMGDVVTDRSALRSALSRLKRGLLQTQAAYHVIEPGILQDGTTQQRAAFRDGRQTVSRAIARVSDLQSELADVESRMATARAEAGGSLANQQQRFANAEREAAPAIATARAQVQTAERELETARERRQDAFIRAPFSGTVARVAVDRGDTVQAGTHALSLTDGDAWEVTVSVPDTYNEYLSAGRRVFATIDGVAGTHTGRITAISPMASSRTRQVQVTVRFSELPVSARDGLFVRLELPVQLGRDLFAVPSRYLHYSYDGPHLLRPDRREVPIRVVRETAETVLIQSPALTATTTIAR